MCAHRLSSVVSSACIGAVGLAWDFKLEGNPGSLSEGLCMISEAIKEI